MSKRTTVQVRVLRALWLRGDHVSAARTVDVSPDDAALLLESGRAELIDKADMEAVRAAVRASNAECLGREKARIRQ